MLRVRAVVLAAVLILLAPLGARAADLVVWWEQGFYPQEDAAVREIIAAFEQHSGKQVELDLPSHNDMFAKVLAAVRGRAAARFPVRPANPLLLRPMGRRGPADRPLGRDRAVREPVRPGRARLSTLFDATTGRRALYALPVGSSTNHVHVWRSLLGQAGFTLDDIPKPWEAFWSFWCEKVQPAVRRATGRNDVYGVGLPMSAKAYDTDNEFFQFMQAYEANYMTREGKLVIDDPEIRRRLIRTMDSYTALYRNGCAPPDAVGWDDAGNNQAFLAQTVAMTANVTLSIPNGLRAERPEDYYKNAVTIEWPEGVDGQPLAIRTGFQVAAAFKVAGHVELAKDFVRFLVGEGWLAHYLDFSSERFMPAMPKLLDQPFWLDPSDPHRMAAAMQFLSRPRAYNYAAASGDWRYLLVDRENVWGKAVHRVATEGISPEQAVDEAIARIKQILAE